MVATRSSDEIKKSFKQGKGCSKCSHTGYKGRIAVYEILVLNQNMIGALAHGDTAAFAKIAHSDPNFVSLQQAALAFAEQGITTIKEAMNVALESQDVARITSA